MAPTDSNTLSQDGQGGAFIGYFCCLAIELTNKIAFQVVACN